jgi:PAS domain-containing protein
MGVRRDWPELVAFLDEALATVKDRNRSAIHDRWVNVRIEHRTDWTFIWSILALVAGVGGSILVVILLWNRRLTREVAVRKQAEERIGEQAALLSGLLDSIPDMVFFKNISGVYLGCNPAFSRFVGRPREEITGRTDYDLSRRRSPICSVTTTG